MEAQLLQSKSKKTDPADKLLQLIEEGDATIILSEENMQASFRILLKYELVLVKDDKIFLTNRGIEAKTLGVQNVITSLPVKPLPANTGISLTKPKNFINSNLSYYILLILGLLMILFIQFWY